MAINITISLTDEEQAFIEDAAREVAPGATPAQILAWAKKQCRNGLRQAAMAEWNSRNDKKTQELLAARRARVNDFPPV